MCPLRKRNIWIALVVIFVILQFIPSGRPEVIENNPDDLLANNPVPENVATLLRNACYDCHSNESHYPWYAYVAPVSYLVNRDIREGREELNFSDWNKFNKIEKAKLLDNIAEEVEEAEMPLPIYPPLHPEARLSDQDRQLIVDWAGSFAESMFGGGTVPTGHDDDDDD